GVAALQKLGRGDETDEFREAVIRVHPKNWRLLSAAAKSYLGDQNIGFMIAGKFERGGHRGGGAMVNSVQRDRTRALQLLQQALACAKDDTDKPAVAELHLQFADVLLTGNGYADAWRLQYLTDLTKLPDYEDGPY